MVVVLFRAASTPGLAQTVVGEPSSALRGAITPESLLDDTEPETVIAGTERARGRPVVRDGDFNAVRERQAPQDGVLVVEELPVVEEGGDALLSDTRAEEDYAPFASPPAGYNPLLFQIEDIAPSDPRINRVPARFARLDPYDPVGFRFGSFIVFPELEIAGSATSNVFSAPNGREDVAAELRTATRIVSNWNVHALELLTTTALTRHNDFDSEDQTEHLIEGRGRLDVTRRTNFQTRGSYQTAQEDRSAVDATQIGDRAVVETSQAELAFNHRFNRLSVQLRGRVSAQEVGPVSTPFGSIDNSDRDTIETAQTIRAAWEFKPTFSVFSETELVQREPRRAAFSDGIDRQSDGGRYRFGVSFGSTSEILRGEIGLGYGDQRFDDPRLVDVEGSIIDANLAWRMNGLTTWLMTARSDITESTTAGTGGVLERQIGLELRHAFRRHLIGSANVNLTKRDYAGLDLNENEIALGTGFEYHMRRGVSLFGRYQHTIFRSEFAFSDFDEDEVRFGVRFRR